MIDKIIEENNKNLSKIEDFKSRSDYFPHILIDDDEKATYGDKEYTIVYFSTLVRIEKDGKWYAVHLVDSFGLPPSESYHTYMQRFIDQAYLLKYMYIVDDSRDELDIIQISEEDRVGDVNKRYLK